MDNVEIARLLGEISDLLELKGENPFRIRAYRNAADAVASAPQRVAGLSLESLLALPAIGKDIAGKIQEIAATGQCGYHQTLLQEFPPTVLDLLRLQGVGPKTAALLYSTLGIATLEALEQAARDGRLRGVKGMGAKKETLVLKALDERKQFAGRRLLADAAAAAQDIVAHLQSHAARTSFEIVGSVRRGAETCGDLDILAVGDEASLMRAFCEFQLVDRVLGQGDTKSSVRLRGGLQADLRLVPGESRGAAMQYFTGSKAHNIALRDRALQRGYKLNEYGLFTIEDDRRIAGATEEEIYAALGLAFTAPELRERRGEIDAAESGRLPRLIERSDLRGDLHSHTNVTDGRDDLETMVAAARAAGLEYLAVTDHSKSLAMANGLDERRALEHAARIRSLNASVDGITLLAGIECDILADGSLDLADDCLAQLDFVVASIHTRFNQDEAGMTNRLLRAIESPYVDVIGHATGRRLLQREPYPVRLETLFDAAAARGVAFEINGQPARLDLNDVNARWARDRGVKLVIGSDAHWGGAFEYLQWGVMTARRAWLEAADVLNTAPLDAFRASLRRRPGRS